jgi:hypothetical protein
MFFVRFSAAHLLGREEALYLELARQGVRTYPPDDGWLRFVTHHDVGAEAAAQACAIVGETVKRLAG